MCHTDEVDGLLQQKVSSGKMGAKTKVLFLFSVDQHDTAACLGSFLTTAGLQS